jgi:hypothetical protein
MVPDSSRLMPSRVASEMIVEVVVAGTRCGRTHSGTAI